jgi:hypothetical protein
VKLFKSKRGKEMKRNIEMRAKTFVPGEEIEDVDAPPARKPGSYEILSTFVASVAFQKRRPSL